MHFYTNCTAIPWTVLYTHCVCDFNTSRQLSSSVTSTNSETLHAEGLLLLSTDTTHLHVIQQQNTHKLLHKRWWDTQIDSREPYGTSSKAKGQTLPDLWTNTINRLLRASSINAAIFLTTDYELIPNLYPSRSYYHLTLFHAVSSVSCAGRRGSYGKWIVFYEFRRSVTKFTWNSHWYLSCARWIQPISAHHISRIKAKSSLFMSQRHMEE